LAKKKRNKENAKLRERAPLALRLNGTQFNKEFFDCG
jgi:hypothetical protein